MSDAEKPIEGKLYKEKINKDGNTVPICISDESLNDTKFLKDYLPNDKYMEREYYNLHIRDRKLVDDIALNVDYCQIYDEYFNAYEHALNLKNRNLIESVRSANEVEELSNKSKRALVLQIVNRKGLGKFITARRTMIQDVYIEEFRKRAVKTCVGVEFVKNELVNLKQKIEELEPEKQIKYTLKLLEQLNDVLKGNIDKGAVTNIQINNNIPEWE